MRAGLAKHGMTLPQVFLLRLLMERGKATPKELAGLVGVTPGNVTGLVTKLEASGLVIRSRDDRDRRVVHIRPTSKARRGMASMHAAALQSLAVAFEEWPTQDILRLQALLERLAAKQPSAKEYRP